VHFSKNRTGDLLEYLLFLVTIAAYFIKGLSGFGPALLVVPLFTLLAGAPFALMTSAVLDLLAGAFLLRGVWKEIDWHFVLPVVVSISAGSFMGAQLVFMVPLVLLRRGIGIILALFIIYLLISPEPQQAEERHPPQFHLWIVGLVSGLCGGLVGMSGPPLVAYMKYNFRKDFFRAQLIVIYLVENFVRLLVYGNRQLLPSAEWTRLSLLIPFMLAGLWLGTRFHSRISEKQFARAVAFILIIPAVKLALF